MGYSEEKIVRLSKKFMAEGFTDFKIKVGSEVEDDIRRCRIMRHQFYSRNLSLMEICRDTIGYEKNLWLMQTRNGEFNRSNICKKKLIV